jgi:pimeloyl-ACP methyl ester carboxylesterase
MDKHIYLISGMGADERIFKHLRFPDGYIAHFLEWLPTIPGESFTDYAARMSTGIEHEHVTLLGVSFGGMLCMEIARQLNVEKVVLISSLKNTQEKPSYFRWVKKMGLLKLLGVPDSIVKHRKYFVKPFLMAESKEERDILNDYMQKTSFDYLRWAIPVVIDWKNEFVPASLIHIHGGKDLTLPLKYVKPTHTIPSGGHLMVFNRAAEINEILYQELK